MCFAPCIKSECSLHDKVICADRYAANDILSMPLPDRKHTNTDYNESRQPASSDEYTNVCVFWFFVDIVKW